MEPFLWSGARSLKSGLVLPTQIFGLFGPPKKRVNFDKFSQRRNVRRVRRFWGPGLQVHYSGVDGLVQHMTFENFPRSHPIFIGPECNHCLLLSLTNWPTNCWVNLIDVTLTCEDASSKLVEVVSVAEDHVGNSLLQIWELTFGPKAKLLFRLWAQGLVKILKLKFRQDFEAGVCSSFRRWCFVEVMKLNLGRNSEARFGQDFEF